MNFLPTPLDGAYVLDIQPHHDERGFFARTWCSRELLERGLEASLTQCSISFNRRKGTLRGMHFQRQPYGETKIIRCTKGSIFDVIIDLREDSVTKGRWCSVELSADSHRMLYIPAGFAHGFQTLSDDTEVYYQISGEYVPDAGRGVRWNDSAFNISWPQTPTVISARDEAYPDYRLRAC